MLSHITTFREIETITDVQSYLITIDWSCNTIMFTHIVTKPFGLSQSPSIYSIMDSNYAVYPRI
jgi:hypothetical protein